MRNIGPFDPANDGNPVNIVGLLKACADKKDVVKGSKLHAYIREHKVLAKNAYIGSTLVHMYAECGALSKAQRVLEELSVRDVVAWSVLIKGYTQLGRGEEALKCFDDMLREGHFPTAVTFSCVLKACGRVKAAAKGEAIHGKIAALGMLDKDIVLGNSLVDMYVKCGALTKAQWVLKELPVRNVVTWSTLISGYGKQGRGEEALKCFDDMLHEGHSPDAGTFACILKACGSIGVASKGKEIHEKIVDLGMLEKNIVLGNTLVDMYVKCGALAKAEGVLRELSVRSMVVWSSLISGYAQQGQGEEALKCFNAMIHDDQCPDAVTFVCVLKACASIGAAAKGKEIHEKIVHVGILDKDIVLGTTLVDMYVKCGDLPNAEKVLEALPIWDVVTWNVLIAGYAQQGQSLKTIYCFEKMQSTGVIPNLMTLTSVLNAYSHSGLLDQAETYFSEMNIKYSIHAHSEHFCCMTDLFGRAGKLNKAISVIADMSSDECLPNWVALLAACRKWGEMKIGRVAFERALDFDKRNAAVYLLMADIYTAGGMQDAG